MWKRNVLIKCIIMETLNNNQQTTGLQIFNNSEIGAKIRTTTERNETWFVAQDICDILNLKNPRM